MSKYPKDADNKGGRMPKEKEGRTEKAELPHKAVKMVKKGGRGR